MQCSPYRTIGRAVPFAPASKAAGLREVDAPQSLVAHFGADTPLKMDAGVSLSPVTIAYQTYGELNADKSNAILVCHALTGDQHVANQHPITGKPGWWHTMVGPGRPIDTNRYFVIAPNVIGGSVANSRAADSSSSNTASVIRSCSNAASSARPAAVTLRCSSSR